ncbi:MAG TPA: HupE/UreJ family protein, partial [Ramlibacter sp.]|nr:HupE/UreJ family protein [Ramlibacter sp.]
FLLAAGCAVALSRLAPRQAMLLLPAYALAGSLGTLVRAPGLDLPWGELAVVLTLAAAAAGLWWQRLPAGRTAGVLAGAAGFVHGYAYGEAVIGAEATPLLAYLLGLALLQCALLGATWLLANRLASRFAPHRAMVSRTLAGLVGAFAVWSGVTLLA